MDFILLLSSGALSAAVLLLEEVEGGVDVKDNQSREGEMG